MLWVRISTRARCTTLCDKVCQWLATGRWISAGPTVSSTNKTDRHEILLKVALNTTKQTNNHLLRCKVNKVSTISTISKCCLLHICLMVFNATFNNISAISWRSVVLMEETGEPAEKTTDLSQVTDKLYHIMLYTSPWSRFELTPSVVIGTDCICSCKSNYHTITTTTIPC